MKRRHLLLGGLGAGGALVLGWGLMPPRRRLTGRAPLPTAAGQQALNGWVKVGTDDRVTIVLAKSEMGQGVSTALAMLLADELDADWARVDTEMAPVDTLYGNLAMVVDGLPFHPDDHGLVQRTAAWLTAKTMREVGLMATGGSSSIKDLWGPMREAGASARAMLVAAAAQGWGVPAADCQVAQGVVRHAASGRSARFGALAEAAGRQPLPKAPALKTAAQYTLIGRPVPRRDSAAKQDGSARFGLDTLLPGQRYASVLLCPTLGGAVASFDASAAQAMPGVLAVVEVPAVHGGSGGVAAIAAMPWQAIAAARAVRVQWRDGPAAGLSSAGIAQQLKQALAEDEGFAYFKHGDAPAALRQAVKTLEAEYEAPLLAHATLEPMNCTVRYTPAAEGRPASAEVWAPTQVPGLARWAAAKALGLDSEQVALQVTLLGGGFGRRLEVDFVAQAAHVARALPGQPVQTFWSREQDQTHDFYRPPCVARYRAGFDAQGRLLAWTAASAGPSIVQQFLQRQFGLPAALTVGPDKTTAEGAFDQPYEWPAARVSHRIVALPVPVGFWRSVGHSHQAFFKESFVDEAAHAAGQDPLAFRLALLQRHPRHAAVLRRAAERAGWGQPAVPRPDGARTARGLALHQSFGSIVAQVAEVSLDPADPKRIRVHRVVAVIDCGVAVNPQTIRQQMDSAIVFGLGAALHGEVTLEAGRVQQTDFLQQPLLRGSECPAIETEILASTEPPEGVGEPGVPPIAPAVANALFALTGQRLRRLPLKLA